MVGGFIQNADRASLLKNSGNGWSCLSLPLILTHVALLTRRFVQFWQVSAQSLEVFEVSKPNSRHTRLVSWVDFLGSISVPEYWFVCMF